MELSDELFNQILTAMRGIADHADRAVNSLTRGSSTARANFAGMNKDVARLGRSITGIYRNLKLDEISKKVRVISATAVEASKTLQKNLAMDFEDWSTFYRNLTRATRELNDVIGRSAVNSSELLKAATKLASIGWSDLKSLEKVTPALANLSRAIGSLTTSFASSVLHFQRVFKEGTSELLEGMSDSLVAYSEVFGLTAQQLQDAQAALSASFLRAAGGNQVLYSQLSDSLNKALALGAQAGLDTTSLTNILRSAYQDTWGDFASKYGALAAYAGVDLSQFQQLVQAGQADIAMVQLISGLQGYLSDLDPQTQNLILKQISSSTGLSVDELNRLIATQEGFLTAVDEINATIVDTEGATSERLSKSILTLGERLSNFLSSSEFISGITLGLQKLGIGSVADLLGATSNLLYSMQGISNLFKSSGLLKVFSPLLDKIKPLFGKGLSSLFSVGAGGMGALLAKLSVVILAIIVAFKTLSKVISSDKFAKAISSILGVVSKLWSVVNNVLETVSDFLAKVIINVLGNGEYFQEIGNILGMFTTILEQFFHSASEILDFVAYMISELITPVRNSITTIVREFSTLLTDMKPVFDVMMDLLGRVISVIVKVMKPVMSFLIPVINPFIILIKNLAKMVQIIRPIISNFIIPVISKIVEGLRAIGNWLADISIFGWHPFEGLRSSGSNPPPLVTEDQFKEITNQTTDSEFAGSSLGGPSYGFGLTKRGFHPGQDVPMASGTPLTASQIGVVTASGFNDLYGNYLSLLGADGIQRVFGHLSALSVGRGDTVLPGQALGFSGNTGESSIPHLHYETRSEGNFIDPYVVAQKGSNADVVQAIEQMTLRLERKLEEVSQQTEDNAEWIRNFDARMKAKAAG